MQAKPFLRLTLIAALALTAWSGAAAEDDWRTWPGGERVRVGVGAFFSDLETIASASESNGAGNATIRFEDDLGLDSSENTLVAAVDWRLARRHSIILGYFELDRSGSNQSSVGLEIDFGDFTFIGTADLPVEAFFDIEVYDVSYRYSPIFNERTELSLGIGLSVQELRLGIGGWVPIDLDDLGIPDFDCSQGAGCEFRVEQVETTAPLPTFEVAGSYALSDNWQLLADVGYFAISLELDPNEDFSGRIWRTSIGARWKPFRNFGVVADYSYFDVDVDYRKRDLFGVLDYRYKGPAIGIEAFF